MKASSLSLRSTLSILAFTAGLGLAALDANAQAPAAQPGARPPQARPAQGQPAPAAQPAPAPAQPAAGQPAAGPATQPQQQEANATVSGWQTRCVSQGRKANAECVVEQALTMLRNNQVATIVQFRVAAEGQAPVVTVRVPHGVRLAAGIRLRVDAGYSVDMPLQTCEAQGCLASGAAAPELINAMRAGRQLFVLMKGGNNQDMGFGMPLEGFPAALDRVK